LDHVKQTYPFGDIGINDIFWTQIMCKILGELSYFSGTGLLEK